MNCFKIILLIAIISLVLGCDITQGGDKLQCWPANGSAPRVEFDLNVSIVQLKTKPECYVGQVVTVQGILRGDGRDFYLFDQESSVKYYDPSKVIQLDATERLATFPASDIANEKLMWVRVVGEYRPPNLISNITSVQILDSRY